MQPKVYIVIVNWNNWQDTIECLESVYHMDYENYAIVVCDNCSEDGSIDKIMAWANGKLTIPIEMANPLNHLIDPPVTKPLPYQQLNPAQIQQQNSSDKKHLILIKSDTNLGFAGGNNLGMKYALANQCDYIWLLNNDTVIAPDCLKEMVKHSQQHAHANTCGSTLLHYYQPQIIQALGGNHFNKWTGLASTSLGRGLSAHEEIDHQYYTTRLSYISGASWLLPRSFIEEIGFMEESYFLYCEEIDWCVRNADRYQLTYAPKAKVYHKEGGSIGSPNLDKPSSLFSDFYIFRNKLRFTKRYFPEALLSNYLTILLQLFNRARRGQWDKAWLIWNLLIGREKNAENLIHKN